MARRERPRRAPANAKKATTGRWLLLIPNLPSARASLRVKVWRRLQGVGAVGLKSSVYVLPSRDDCVETFQWIAREIGELGGSASLCEGQFFDGVTDEEIERKFVEVRNADYAELGGDVRELAKALSARRLSPDKLSALEAQFVKLKRRFDEIVAIDFCQASERGGAEGLMMALERSIAAKRSPPKEPERIERSPRPHGATWVTRTGVHVDRIGCAWLVRRFIDPAAKLKFVPPKGYVPEKGELRFDMYDAEFTHVGNRCSFEVLLECMGIEDPALTAIAQIVHDIDLRDEKFGRTETPGVRSQITGLCTTHRDDLARIAAATPMLDALHSFFTLRSRGIKRGTQT